MHTSVMLFDFACRTTRIGALWLKDKQGIMKGGKALW